MNLVEHFESLDVDVVEKYIAEHKAETLHLEFKGISDSTLKLREDRKNLAKSLSGFANADGGIVVWGVETKKIDDVDVAVSDQRLPNVQALEGRLLELEGEAVNPMVNGMRHKAIRRPDGSGFAATLVPASDRGPHMGKLGENRYYKRSGTSFWVCEHFDLEDMFGRRPRPSLEVRAKIIPGVLMLGTYQYDVIIGIRNSGRGTARYPFLAVSVSPMGLNEHGLDGNGRHGLDVPVTHWVTAEFQETFAGGTDSVIHPSMTLDVTRTQTRRVHSTDRITEDVVITYRLCADGIQPVDDQLVVSGAEILAAIEAIPDFPGWE